MHVEDLALAIQQKVAFFTFDLNSGIFLAVKFNFTAKTDLFILVLWIFLLLRWSLNILLNSFFFFKWLLLWLSLDLIAPGQEGRHHIRCRFRFLLHLLLLCLSSYFLFFHLLLLFLFSWFLFLLIWNLFLLPRLQHLLFLDLFFLLLLLKLLDHRRLWNLWNNSFNADLTYMLIKVVEHALILH